MKFWPFILLVALQLRGASFTAPLGVPTPPFGITNTHWMYTNSGFTWDYGSGAVPYRTTTNGPYTYYIDKTIIGAADGTNTWGTPTKPRLTWPANIAAGAVVEIHNGPYLFNNLDAKMQLHPRGTTNLPVFFRGVSTNDRPSITKDITFSGSYVVIENIDTAESIYCRLDLDLTNNTHNVCIRDSHFHGHGNETGSSSAIGGFGFFRFADIKPNYASNIVVWNNSIHGYGPIVPGEEHDWVGVTADGYSCQNVWIMDNDIYNMGGDSIRIGSNSDLSHPPTSHYAYVSRNSMHDNGENSIDVKMWNDAVVGENLMYGGFTSVSSSGARVAAHYNPTNVWFLANTMYNAPEGIGFAGVVDFYVLGNVFRDLYGRGVELFGGGNIVFVGNTFSRCNEGIVNIGGSVPVVPIVNNIFYPCTNASIGYDLSGFASTRMDHNLFYQDGSNLNIQWAGTTYTSVASLSNSTTAGDFCLQVDPIYLGASTNNFNVDTNSSPAYGTGTNIAVWTGLFFDRFGVSIDSYFKPNGTNMIGAYITEVVPDQPPGPLVIVGTRHPRGGRRFNIR